ncbi:MAG: MHYT domain-containing protein [Pseudomonadota bacterium]
MPVTHEPWLVALSLAVAIQGSYVGLSLAVQLRAVEGLRRRLRLAGAALSLGVGIWAMHFVAMLAARLPGTVDFLVFPTLLSFLVCVIVVGLALVAASFGRPTPWRIAAAAIFMGLGIVSMHYTGMTALHASLHLEHDVRLVGASVLIAIAASSLALWLGFGARRHPPLIVSATALGLAIAGMHYTAMAGLTVWPMGATATPLPPALSVDLLAIVVAVVAFLVSGIFLLTLVPDHAGPAAITDAPGAGASTSASRGNIAPERAPAAVAISPAPSGPAPLGGLGRPPRRFGDPIPVERAGAAQMIRPEDVFAVHANAHYTYVFNGSDDLFCSLSISEIEERLDPERFVRVHRSHIVNLDHILAIRKAGDTGQIELAGSVRRNIPVSRAKLPSLKARFGIRSAVPVRQTMVG